MNIWLKKRLIDLIYLPDITLVSFYTNLSAWKCVIDYVFEVRKSSKRVVKIWNEARKIEYYFVKSNETFFFSIADAYRAWLIVWENCGIDNILLQLVGKYPLSIRSKMSFSNLTTTFTKGVYSFQFL